MSNNLKLFHLSIVQLYKDFDNDTSRKLVKLSFEQLSDEEKDLLKLVCNGGPDLTDLIL